MAYGGYSYIDKKYEPEDDDFIVLFWLDGHAPVEKLAEAVASESSVGTWTKISTMKSKVFRLYRARIFKIIKVTKDSGFVYMAYPYEHFDDKNVMQLFAGVLGNLFGLKELEDCYVLDVKLPERYQRQFKGPGAGIKGIRRYVGTTKSKRPHVGTIVKPKVGLTPKEFADVAYKAWLGGLDLVKDDENLVDQKFCPWKDRFDRVANTLDRVEAKTGEKKLYATNITDSNIERMIERLEHVKDSGMKMVMLDVFILGTPTVMKIVDEARKAKLFVHAHRAGYAAHHRGNFGINFGIYEKFWRLAGVDQLHIGTGVGKMEGGVLLINHFHRIAEDYHIPEKFYLGSLGETWWKKIKPILSVASGGMDPGKVEAAVAIHGKNVVIQAGGGVHGHPGGTLAGARALRQAADAIAEGISPAKYAKTHKELRDAIKTWGYVDPDTVKAKFAFEKGMKRKMLEWMVLKKGLKGIRAIWEEL